jgi:alkylation response protein AidB-like acyl-CoA dehydrogenase
MVDRMDHDDLNQLDDGDFRELVRNWVRENYPPQLCNPRKRLHWSDSKAWYSKLAEKGWLAPAWPREYGGLALSAGKQLILIEEFEQYGVARFNDHGINMVGPLLIRFGTPAQRDYFLPQILNGSHIWCQGYSEPNAGSDLASLRSRAVLEADHYIVNGQKTWSTLANDANWMFMLVRTDPDAKKQEGISFLLVPMDSPGITVRPIINLDMHDEFCEVFFDNVVVPATHLVGEPNRGWSMAKALLGFERIFLGSPRQSEYALRRLETLARQLGYWNDGAFMDTYAQLSFDLDDLKALYETFLARTRMGEAVGPEVSMLKVFQSELLQRISQTTLSIAGVGGALLEPLEPDSQAHAGALFVNALPASIYGGTNEIQRNILAKSVLQLPD